jgi:hypothetical protein
MNAIYSLFIEIILIIIFILYPCPLWNVQGWSLVKVPMVQTHRTAKHIPGCRI